MSRILIALYMGVVAGYDRHTQGPNYGDQRGAEGRFRQPEEHDPFPGLDCVQPAGGDFAHQQNQKGSQTATDDRRIRNGAR